MQFKVEAEGEEKERRKKMKIVHYRYTEEYKLKELLEAYKEGRRTYYKLLLFRQKNVGKTQLSSHDLICNLNLSPVAYKRLRGRLMLPVCCFKTEIKRIRYLGHNLAIAVLLIYSYKLYFVLSNFLLRLHVFSNNELMITGSSKC